MSINSPKLEHSSLRLRRLQRTERENGNKSPKRTHSAEIGLPTVDEHVNQQGGPCSNITPSGTPPSTITSSQSPNAAAPSCTWTTTSLSNSRPSTPVLHSSAESRFSPTFRPSSQNSSRPCTPTMISTSSPRSGSMPSSPILTSRRMTSSDSDMKPVSSPKLAKRSNSLNADQIVSSSRSASESDSHPSTPTNKCFSSNPVMPSSLEDSRVHRRHMDAMHSQGNHQVFDEGCDYIEEEKPLLPGIMIRAATLNKLVESVIECFNTDGTVISDCELPRGCFLMHEWFVGSKELADTLLSFYHDDEYQPECCVPQCPHHGVCLNCPKLHHKTKVCHVIRYWIGKFPMHFDLKPGLSETMHKFQMGIEDDGDSQHSELVDVSKVPSYEFMRNSSMSVKNPVSRMSPSKKTSLVINKLQPSQLAEQLTYLEYKAFRRLTFTDFKNYAIHATLRDNPKLERSVALFNGLSQWIQCMVLCKTTPQQRSEVIVKFIYVAQRLLQLQNFNTLMAVVGGLTHSALARLTKTNGCITPDAQKILGECTELLSSNNNFSNYRRALHQSDGFHIPILGVHLRDLILLHTALPDRIGKNLINFRKMTQLSITFTELMKVQSARLPIEANMDLISTIKVSLDLHYTEDEIYELSLAREPRNSLSSPSTPTKHLFSEWVAGISPPDTETINKHVHDMVEAVFKNYDHDRDGFISHAEFEEIAGNFPFIDSFCVLDADQDGMISKTEMKTYFIRANCHALRNSFKHAFHETTFFKPTFCIHCTGLCWGLIKQGWKCKECGINAHKHCKDLVVMECRPKPHQNVN